MGRAVKSGYSSSEIIDVDKPIVGTKTLLRRIRLSRNQARHKPLP